jgi:histidyl-tRNA synthetase
MKLVQAVRGMKDILPDESPSWQHVESTLIQKVMQCGYQEIRSPILEKTELFHRTIGEVTDIVAKEMYTFADRNGDSLSLRPEGTACCVRAAIENGLLHNQTQRLWYQGPMFRHERPQKGRYRQFYQLGVEAFGWSGPDLDIEQLLLAHSFWQALGLEKSIRLELNSLGTPAERKQYRIALVTYLKQHHADLNAEAQERLESNPLRILDSKDPAMQPIIQEAPNLLDYLESDSLKFFETIQSALNAADVAYTVNPRLVRGLDYYCHTVFEWITDELGAQGTICGGGRFDGLVELIAGKSVPAVGFALGIDRLVALMLAHQAPQVQPVHIFMIAEGEAAQQKALLLANEIRRYSANLNVICNAGGGKFKKQFERANKSGAEFALILGEAELQADTISIKYLREDRPQQTVSVEAFLERCGKKDNSKNEFKNI